jgi:uncharacterized coiled-coil DUF342 family protein
MAADSVTTIRHELAELRAQVAQMRADLDEVRNAQHGISDEVRTLKDALGG